MPRALCCSTADALPPPVPPAPPWDLQPVSVAVENAVYASFVADLFLNFCFAYADA